MLKGNCKHEELDQQGKALPFLSSYESFKYSAQCRNGHPDDTKVFQVPVITSGWWTTVSILPNNVKIRNYIYIYFFFLQSFLLDNLRHSVWSEQRRPGCIQTSLKRQPKEQLYLHVSYQGLYHTGPENTQLTVSVRCGKQISQCQDVSRSSRWKGGRGGKENKKQKLFSWPQQKKLPPVSHLVLACLFLKFYSLQRSSDA